MTVSLERPVKCSYCGTPGHHRIHSGVYECQSCWDWRKMLGPAVKHWYTVSAVFLSNVDMYDQIYFPEKVGMTQEEFLTMLKTANKLFDACNKMLDERSDLRSMNLKPEERTKALIRKVNFHEDLNVQKPEGESK